MSKSNNPPSLINTIKNWIAASTLGAIALLFVVFGLWNDFALFIWASVSLSVLLFVILSAHFIYYHAKAYNRNAVAWATAFVVFSPLWAGVVYLLTWPKGDQA